MTNWFQDGWNGRRVEDKLSLSVKGPCLFFVSKRKCFLKESHWVLVSFWDLSSLWASLKHFFESSLNSWAFDQLWNLTEFGLFLGTSSLSAIVLHTEGIFAVKKKNILLVFSSLPSCFVPESCMSHQSFFLFYQTNVSSLGFLQKLFPLELKEEFI